MHSDVQWCVHILAVTRGEKYAETAATYSIVY